MLDLQKDWVWVIGAHDDGPTPVVGLVVDVVDEENVKVLWGDAVRNYTPFDPVPITALLEPMDELANCPFPLPAPKGNADV